MHLKQYSDLHVGYKQSHHPYITSVVHTVGMDLYMSLPEKMSLFIISLLVKSIVRPYFYG